MASSCVEAGALLVLSGKSVICTVTFLVSSSSSVSGAGQAGPVAGPWSAGMPISSASPLEPDSKRKLETKVLDKGRKAWEDKSIAHGSALPTQCEVMGDEYSQKSGVTRIASANQH